MRRPDIAYESTSLVWTGFLSEVLSTKSDSYMIVMSTRLSSFRLSSQKLIAEKKSDTRTSSLLNSMLMVVDCGFEDYIIVQMQESESSSSVSLTSLQA